MGNKRKSMNAGDVHAYKLRGVQPQIYLRSKGFRDAALTSGAPWALLAIFIRNSGKPELSG